MTLQCFTFILIYWHDEVKRQLSKWMKLRHRRSKNSPKRHGPVQVVGFKSFGATIDHGISLTFKRPPKVKLIWSPKRFRHCCNKKQQFHLLLMENAASIFMNYNYFLQNRTNREASAPPGVATNRL